LVDFDDKSHARIRESEMVGICETPIAQAIRYSRNQRDALSRFLEDGRLPAHNNWSEAALRREVVGRRNWLFLGNDDAGDVNASRAGQLAQDARPSRHSAAARRQRLSPFHPRQGPGPLPQ
jgi:hypothetical protein